MMIGRFPDSPTPIGCLVGFLAIFPAAFSVIASWGAYKAFGRTPPEVEIGWGLIRWGAITAVPAAAGIAYSLFRIATGGKREHHLIGKSLST